ncbi:hypothetical protein [Paraburkholderia unamae]|uniref:Uncharacterized protein n=1 Tax=Paraburkholderia unamae TaxID=219649 RepID=A0ABX5KT91_9BURK|nr:hypothetical protein [Paraburkholderia unamae]PVX84314.1 hypothetical protein C7402_105155 [Paraburkholderia unamae]
MTASNDLWRQVASIRNAANISAVDRELLRPVFASFDNGEVRAVPERVQARIRFYAAQQPAK